MKTATTLLEISKILKLSPSTVSRALKNHPDIAPATRTKVLELADKLDYEPNLNAVGLRTSNSKEVAVIVPNLSGFFYDSFISAVEEECRRAGFSLIVLVTSDDPELEAENVRICKQRRVKGVLVCITPQSVIGVFEKLARIEIPVVFFDKIPDSDQFSTVRVDDEKAANLAANHLLSKGRKHILSIFGDLKMSISARRLKEYRNVLDREEDRLVVIKEAPSAKEAEEIVTAYYSSGNKPDAIFCMSDEILIGVMKALQILKVRYPEETGVLAISNGFFPRLYYPEISYVETSGYKLGKSTFERMLDFINGNIKPGDLTVPPVLVEAGSI